MIHFKDYKLFEDKQLALFIVKGDELAFEELFNRYRPQVYHVALQYLKCTELAKCTVQEVFFKIWKGRTSLTDINFIRAWIYQITKNHVLNKLKKALAEDSAKDYLSTKSTILDTSTLEHIDYKESFGLFQDALTHLPEQQRLVFELARFEKLTYEDISKKLNISPLTVKTHMARALRSLRLKMMSLGIDIPIVFFCIFFS